MDNLQRHVEAIIFSSEKPVTMMELIEVLNNLYEDKFFESEALMQQIEDLKKRYTSDEYAFYLAEIGGGYQFLTKKDYHKTISLFLNQRFKKKLSSAALETLAIIAYKQPITKQEAEQIRGVSCDYTITKLLEKELIEIVGRDETPGRPVLYGLSETFMEYFGINSVNDLPKPKDLSSTEGSAIGDTE